MTLPRAALFASVFACFAGSAALAAPPPSVNWTGGYLGALAGYGWSSTTAGTTSFWNDTGGTSLAGTIPGFSWNGSGWVGGAETGVGWENSGIYWGLEADIAAANITGTYTDSGLGFSTDSTLKWLSTARLRIGVPMNNLLLFGTGGLAVGGIEATLRDTYPGPTVLTTTDTQTGVGWALGGGAALALHGGWSAKAEFLYVDLGSRTSSFPEDPSGSTGWPLITTPAKTTASILRFGLDYRY